MIRTDRLARLYRIATSQITPPRLLVISALLAAALALAALLRLTGSNVNPMMVRSTLMPFGIWAPLALIVTLAVVLVVPVIPASILQIGAGLAFGPWLGLLYTLIADVSGASIGFLIARRWANSVLERHLSPEMHARLVALTKRMNWQTVVLLRLIPGPGYPLVSLAAGHSRLSFPRFITASLAGVFPALVLLVLAGDLVDSSPLLAFAIVVLLVGSLALAGHFLGARSGTHIES